MGLKEEVQKEYVEINSFVGLMSRLSLGKRDTTVYLAVAMFKQLVYNQISERSPEDADLLQKLVETPEVKREFNTLLSKSKEIRMKE